MSDVTFSYLFKYLNTPFVFADSKMNSNSLAMSAPAAAAATSATGAEGEHEEQQEGDGHGGGGSPKQAVNPGEEEKRESVPVTAIPNVACGFQER